MLRLLHRFLSVGFPTGELLERAHHEHGDDEKIARGEPPRFGDQAEEPLDAGALHPHGRSRRCAGVKIESRANPDQRRRVNPVDVRGHPFLLFRHPEPDPDEIGLCLVDGRDIGRVLFSAQRTERRRSIAGDDESRVAPGQS